MMTVLEASQLIRKWNNHSLLPVLFIAALIIIVGCNNDNSNIIEQKPSGEFDARMEMAVKRLTTGQFLPVFTNEFILADVNIDPDNPRRFFNYSGDLSGRYIEALSFLCTGSSCGRIDTLVRETLKYQHKDGRFGDTSLVFLEKYIGREHMPLLWGNGRMLTGLLEYYNYTRDSSSLKSARMLGDFFLATYRQVTPAVSKRLEGLGADGIICFTQYVEPLVRLSVVTGDTAYATAAAEVYRMLPERGILHSHGYLTTLRGVLELYDYDRKIVHFNYVRDAYKDLVSSDDFTVYGSVQEYFGKRGERDEGCSTADLIRLSLHLYRITGDAFYLEKAEFALYNALYFNQFFTGDFGHHTFDTISSYSPAFNAAWWCCTMSGLRALQVVKNEGFIESKGDTIRLNLFLDTDYSDTDISLVAKRGMPHGDFHSYIIRLRRITADKSLVIRKPSWTTETEIYINGRRASYSTGRMGFTINQALKEGDEIDVRMKYLMCLHIPGGQKVNLGELVNSTRGVLCYGPHVMAVDNNLDFTFLSEPNNNSIYAHTISASSDNENVRQVSTGSYIGDLYLTANYKHGGFPSYYQTVLRPVSEMTFARHPYMMVMLSFMPEG